MNFLQRSLLLVALILSAASVRSFADPVVVNGGFETGDFTSWTLTDSSSFTHVSSDIVHQGTYAAALGAENVLGTLSQTVSDTAGTSYTLYFYLSSDYTGPSTFSVRVNGRGGFDLTNLAAGGFSQYSTTFTGTGSDVILFSFRDDASFLRLDDVSLTNAGAGGPGGPGVAAEPGGIVLFGTGLLSVAGFARRRNVRL